MVGVGGGGHRGAGRDCAGHRQQAEPALVLAGVVAGGGGRRSSLLDLSGVVWAAGRDRQKGTVELFGVVYF